MRLVLFLVAITTIIPRTNGQCTYMVEVFTGDREGAGTDADVFLRLANSADQSLNFQLQRPGNNFERNAVDRFVATNACIGRICKVEVTQNGKYPSSSWYVKGLNVSVRQSGSNKCVSREIFTIDQWVRDPVMERAGNGFKTKYHWMPASNCDHGALPNPRC
ncbi:hypothetical protein SELMODRAFT_443445 [Selaginella moellendorffii]|uniref:PLAT domain-containing protein n=1 Tax=Selaginella moellendorffii TaxID=88036 RepID=D8S1G3_SELML|nr:lipoxygenase homology domain-containing protein 1 [Selaginella moellendorffii]XP_024537896.1 lipoxygenase homology domain-containing protein 1 [Selaginella moellendorffii]EFJ21845.1 hypothetical protein SELMODRAFT_443445 [Selaginella moellendorffii]|eukprot:XP_002977236.1 lipoxygenase homology domain-containing protein 1 [Selaginella moellendorffii]